MSFTTTHRNGFTTARCDNPRCGHEFTWRGPTDSPSVWARKNIRGHVCPKWRPGQVGIDRTETRAEELGADSYGNL